MGLVVSSKPRPLYLRKRPSTQGIGGWVDHHGRSVRVRKISPPPGFDPRVVQARRDSLRRPTEGNRFARNFHQFYRLDTELSRDGYNDCVLLPRAQNSNVNFLLVHPGPVVTKHLFHSWLKTSADAFDVQAKS
jgi:hypothetical protein